MRPSDEMPNPATHTTEITVATGDRYVVRGAAKDIERLILDAARGSLMQLAWLTEAETGNEFAVNPESVVLLRVAGPDTAT
jgi:hypothetical protein